MVRADVFKRINGFNEIMVGGEDHDHFRRLAKVGQTYYMRELLVYHS